MKIRVVFDASAKSVTGVSLNECLYAGPKLQLDIVDVLTLFRTHKYVFSTNICKNVPADMDPSRTQGISTYTCCYFYL